MNPIHERELFELVYRRMRNLVPPNAPDFEDLVQAAATEAWRSLPRFEGRSELGTWIYTLCYRVLSNHRRWWRRYQQRFSVGVEDVFPSDRELPPELLDERARTERLRTLLGRMSDKYRAVVVLHDLEGFTVSEISGIVATSENTVRSRLRDGRKQLRRLLELDPVLVLEEA
ncbi:MAG TPA: sigma-70 family RNA polymerase sigma factor [Polyangiaceae bacterium]|nr:sigma-70 family RNA polymerase sigma factor [Polyangiaceae bacterium]